MENNFKFTELQKFLRRMPEDLRGIYSGGNNNVLVNTVNELCKRSSLSKDRCEQLAQKIDGVFFGNIQRKSTRR